MEIEAVDIGSSLCSSLSHAFPKTDLLSKDFKPPQLHGTKGMYLSAAAAALNRELLQASLMGDFQKSMQHLLYLVSIAPIARVMIKLDNWAPAVRNGREVQTKTVLGPALGITSLPDIDWHFGRMITAVQPQPNVAMTLFRSPDSRAAEVSLKLPVVKCKSAHIWLLLLSQGQ